MVTIFYGEDSNKESLPCLASDEPAAPFLTETKSETGSEVEVERWVNTQKKGAVSWPFGQSYISNRRF